MMGMETVQEARGVRQMKLRVAGLDANKEEVRGCMREARHVENRVVCLGQSVKGEHSENRGKSRAKNSKLKRDGNESRPAIERAAADVQRISNGRRPVLKIKATQAPGQAAQQSNKGHEVALQAERFGKTLDGKRSVGIETAIACLADFFHGMNEFLGCRKLTHHAVNV